MNLESSQGIISTSKIIHRGPFLLGFFGRTLKYSRWQIPGERDSTAITLHSLWHDLWQASSLFHLGSIFSTSWLSSNHLWGVYKSTIFLQMWGSVLLSESNSESFRNWQSPGEGNPQEHSETKEMGSEAQWLSFLLLKEIKKNSRTEEVAQQLRVTRVKSQHRHRHSGLPVASLPCDLTASSGLCGLLHAHSASKLIQKSQTYT